MNKSQQIDWSDPTVPEWANAVVIAPCGSEYYVEAWGGKSKRQLVGNDFIDGVGADMTGEGNAWRLACERPVQWSGEDLPLVGTELEVNTVGDVWVRAVFAYRGKHACVFDYADGEWVTTIEQVKFRPIRTPEQIAWDKRENAAKALFQAVLPHPASTPWERLPQERRLHFMGLIDAGWQQVAP